MKETYDSSQGPRDDVQPKGFLFFFAHVLGLLSERLGYGFVGLAAMTITNFQNFWKVFQRSRKAELCCYNYSAE